MIQPFSLTNKLISEVARQHGAPVFVYSREYLRHRANKILELCQPHSVTVRYALKANPHPEIIKMFQDGGLQFDASSEYEALDLLTLGVPADRVSLSSQQPPLDMAKTLKSGVKFVATSLRQLDLVRQSGWQGEIGVRINPGRGSGHNNRTTTGGPAASFGIWHEYLPQIIDWQQKSGCQITRLHIHVGSGGEDDSRQTIQKALELAGQLEFVTGLDMGGGFKVARVPGEKEVDLAAILKIYSQEVSEFNQKTGRDVRLEIEPGTWLVANAGVLVAEIIDAVDTGKNGYKFLRLNTGMNDILRPAMYGAQHPIEVLNDAKDQEECVVVGHNCESGDILTPAPGDPESIQPRILNKAQIGDLVAIGGAGAYCASMRAIGYNSFPPAAEVLV